MNRTIVAGIAAGAVVVVGASVAATNPSTRSLPDVQVPAVALSNAEGTDATIEWLDLFVQSSGGSTDSLGATLLDSGPAAAPSEIPLVIIDPQNQTEDFTKILDGAVGNAGSQLNAITAPSSGKDAVSFLILKNGS